MDMYMLFVLIFVLFFSFVTLFFIRKVAKRIQLVDKPNSRKLHSGSIPLAGGISICITLAYFVFSNSHIIEYSLVFIPLMVLLTAIGALDDKFDLSVKVRIVIQCFVAIAMMYFTGNQLQSLGNLFGFGVIDISYASYVLTIIAVIGSINAFNMVDGVDGLLGGLSIVTFSSILVLAFLNNNQSIVYLSGLIIAATIPYLLMNLSLLGRERKVFMGDAGSMLIGFTVIWMLVSISQPEVASESHNGVRPVTALWIIAIPIMDMAAIMFRRIKRGESPFKPDRDHLHHIFQRLGFSPLQTSFLIFFISALLAAIGVISDIYKVPDYIMFYSFLVLFSLYFYLLNHIWKISSYIRKKLGIELKNEHDIINSSAEISEEITN
jgi:UDP-GlcNAc:undecaprenyl-phosphate GlcNAc-1-phosphate transferase